MNAIQLLKNDHETAKRMLGQILGARAEQRRELWLKLEPELKIHEQLEEEALYGPVAREHGSRDATLQEWPSHHREEVAELETLLRRIDAADPMADQWVDRVKDLQRTLEHHIREEEGTVWPRIQGAWDQAALEKAGQRMEALKREKLGRAA